MFISGYVVYQEMSCLYRDMSCLYHDMLFLYYDMACIGICLYCDMACIRICHVSGYVMFISGYVKPSWGTLLEHRTNNRRVADSRLQNCSPVM